MMPGPYDRTTWRGHTFNQRTVAMLEVVESDLGVTLTIFQGSYNAGGVSASAGTHDGGGAVDAWCSLGGDRLQHAMRAVGFAAWHRLPIPGLWGEHVHGIAIGDKQMSTGARAQVIAYHSGLDGLADHRPDHTWRPNPIPIFNYQEATDVTLDDKLANGKTVGEALLAVTQLQQQFTAFRTNIHDRDVAFRQEVRARLKNLPEQTRNEVEKALGDLLPDNAGGAA